MQTRASLLIFGLCAAAGCGGDNSDGPLDGREAIPADAGSADGSVPAQSGTGTGVTTDTGVASSVAPGPAIFDAKTVGTGPCAGKTLQAVIDAVGVLQPSLADIQRIRPSGLTIDGDFIYAFAKADGGFALAFKRGRGDCPSGCLADEYWYFETDATCAPRQSGHYSSGWSTKNCVAVEGTRLWNVPRAPDPIYVCGADNSAQDVTGTYVVKADGDSTACTAAKGSEPRVPKSMTLQMIIAQDTQDPAKGTVTFTGTGHTGIDGHAIPATFSRRRFTASEKIDDQPSTCPGQTTLSAAFDFEGMAVSELRFSEWHTLDCPGSDRCKGFINLKLSLPQE